MLSRIAFAGRVTCPATCDVSTVCAPLLVAWRPFNPKLVTVTPVMASAMPETLPPAQLGVLMGRVWHSRCERVGLSTRPSAAIEHEAPPRIHRGTLLTRPCACHYVQFNDGPHIGRAPGPQIAAAQPCNCAAASRRGRVLVQGTCTGPGPRFLLASDADATVLVFAAARLQSMVRSLDVHTPCDLFRLFVQFRNTAPAAPRAARGSEQLGSRSPQPLYA